MLRLSLFCFLVYFLACFVCFFCTSSSRSKDRLTTTGMVNILRSQRPFHYDLLVTISSVPCNHTVSPHVAFFSFALPAPATGTRSQTRFVESPALEDAFAGCCYSPHGVILRNYWSADLDSQSFLKCTTMFYFFVLKSCTIPWIRVLNHFSTTLKYL